MARRLGDGLPGGEEALRSAVWEFMRPILSPALAALNREAFVTDGGIETTVNLEGYQATSSLDDLALEIDSDK